jgi:serine/threonine protein kinase
MGVSAVQRDPFGLAGALLDGRFRIEREVAEGGFGVVYCATQTALDRPVAIKVLKTPASFDESAKLQFRERFAHEAKTIARIRHPNIVDVYDFGVSAMPAGEMAPWMALEWLEGETLEQQLERRRGGGGRTSTAVMELLHPVLQAFAFAHKQGVVHRDIKPANIMVVPQQHGTMLRVLDFGIAKVASPDDAAGTGLTKTGGIPAFSPLYAAPEQVAFGRTGPWTDVHALGLILTEMLTDQLPYGAQDLQLFEEIMAQQRPTPRSKGIDVGPWESVLQRAVALSPSERWKSAGELLAALEASLDKRDAAVSIGRTVHLNPLAKQPVAAPVHAIDASPARPSPRGRPFSRAAVLTTVAVCGVLGGVLLFRSRSQPLPGPLPPAGPLQATAPQPAAPPPAREIIAPPPDEQPSEPCLTHAKRVPDRHLTAKPSPTTTPSPSATARTAHVEVVHQQSPAPPAERASAPTGYRGSDLKIETKFP